MNQHAPKKSKSFPIWGRRSGIFLDFHNPNVFPPSSHVDTSNAFLMLCPINMMLSHIIGPKLNFHKPYDGNVDLVHIEWDFDVAKL
jgi:hypothetical protein